jgi:hypothetical protein
MSFISCPACDTPNPESNRFCLNCGAALFQQASPPKPATAQTPSAPQSAVAMPQQGFFPMLGTALFAPGQFFTAQREGRHGAGKLTLLYLLAFTTIVLLSLATGFINQGVKYGFNPAILSMLMAVNLFVTMLLYGFSAMSTWLLLQLGATLLKAPLRWGDGLVVALFYGIGADIAISATKLLVVLATLNRLPLAGVLMAIIVLLFLVKCGLMALALKHLLAVGWRRAWAVASPALIFLLLFSGIYFSTLLLY